MAPSTDERILITRAAQRDPGAFSELYIQYYEIVLRRVHAIITDGYAAEDVTTEAFLRAWNDMERLQYCDISVLDALGAIAERLAMNHMLDHCLTVGTGEARTVGTEAIWDANPVKLRSATEELASGQRYFACRHFLRWLVAAFATWRRSHAGAPHPP